MSTLSLVTDADATSSWWIAWYSCEVDSFSRGVQMPPAMSGAIVIALISLKVSQCFTRLP